MFFCVPVFLYLLLAYKVYSELGIYASIITCHVRVWVYEWPMRSGMIVVGGSFDLQLCEVIVT